MIKIFYKNASNILNQTLTRGNLVACASSLVSVIAIRALFCPRMHMTDLLNEPPKKLYLSIFAELDFKILEVLNFTIVGIVISRLFGGSVIAGAIAGASSRPLLWIAARISLYFNPVINEKKIKSELEKNEINESELASSFDRIRRMPKEKLRYRLTLELFQPFIEYAEELVNIYGKVQEAEKIFQILLKVFLLDESILDTPRLDIEVIHTIFSAQQSLKIKVGVSVETLMQSMEISKQENRYNTHRLAFLTKVIHSIMQREQDEDQLILYKSLLHKIMDFAIENQKKPGNCFNYHSFHTIENSILSCLKIIDSKHEEQEHEKQGIVSDKYALYDKLILHIRCGVQYYSGYRYTIDPAIELHHFEKLSIIGSTLATWGEKITTMKHLSLEQHFYQKDLAIPNDVMKKIYYFFPVRRLAKMREISKNFRICIDQDPVFKERFLSELISRFTLYIMPNEGINSRSVKGEIKNAVEHVTKLGIALIDISELDWVVLDQSLVQKSIQSAHSYILPLMAAIKEENRPPDLKILIKRLNIDQS